MLQYCLEVVNIKSKDVLRLLQISRPTLTKYVKTGVISVDVLPNGQYDYNEEDVYKIINKGGCAENLYLCSGFNFEAKAGFRKSN